MRFCNEEEEEVRVSQLDIMDYLSTQTMLHGDCLEEMRKMADNSIDFVVCDPPYGLTSKSGKGGFMGKEWDGKIPGIEYWQEILRICKPGSMLAAFGGTRTHHHLMLTIEEAGWEIRDCMLYWGQGQGFPKSHNFGNKLGGEWKGYGTALKPAYEPIILAMKPLDVTFAQNAEKWGVAGINIEDSRVEGKRWPSNLIIDEEAAEQIDEMTGISKSSNRQRNNKPSKNNCMSGANTGHVSYGYNDSGGSSRFFYCAKASSKERNAGLEGMPIKQTMGGGGLNNTPDDVCGKYGSIKAPQQNPHPTVKPISLMKYILKLLAPPGSPICLDPFAGSGSTLLAAKELGINCIGIEKELEYYEIAKRRVENYDF